MLICITKKLIRLLKTKNLLIYTRCFKNPADYKTPHSEENYPISRTFNIDFIYFWLKIDPINLMILISSISLLLNQHYYIKIKIRFLKVQSFKYTVIVEDIYF